MKIRFTICLKLVLIVLFMFHCTNSVKNLFENGEIPAWKGSPIKYIEYIISAALTHRVDPAMIAAVVAVESNFNPNARSYAGAGGLMQINGVTARYLKIKDIYDPRANIQAGTRYLRELSETFNGDTKLMLAAYNAGPGAVKRFKGVPPYRETQKYIEKVMHFFYLYKTHPELNNII